METPGSTFGQALSKPVSSSNSQVASLLRNKQDAERRLNYMAFICCQEQNIIVDAWLPDTVQLDVNARYDAPFAQGLGDMFPTLGNMARFAGLTLTTQALTTQVWQGGSEFSFSLPLIFQAENSDISDVMIPIKKLLKLTMPKDPTKGGLLEAPGPHLDSETFQREAGPAMKTIATDTLSGAASAIGSPIDTFKSLSSDALGKAKNAANTVARPISQAIVNSVKNNISLYIGRFQYFPSVVITDVSPTFDVVIGPNNNPVRASVIVQFKTFYTPTDDDIEDMFPSAKDGSSLSQTDR